MMLSRSSASLPVRSADGQNRYIALCKRLILLGIVGTVTVSGRAQAQASSPLVNFGNSYLAEDGQYHVVIGGAKTVVMTVDREYNVIGLKIKESDGIERIAGYVLSPRDDNSSASVMFGAPRRPKTDEYLRHNSPGFVGFEWRENGTKERPINWRQWCDAQHIDSDTTMTVPVEGESPGQTQAIHVELVTNFRERRNALEDHFANAKVVDMTAALARVTPLTRALKATKLGYAKWQAMGATATELRWLNDRGDEVAFSLEDVKPLQGALSNTAELRAYWRAQAHTAKGGIVSADIIPAGNGLPRHAVLIAKYPLTAIAGWAYQAVALFPSASGVWKVEVRSREMGTTGTREAVVTMVILAKNKGAAGRAIMDHFYRDPYDAKYDGEACYMLSDAPEWDKGLDQHPLTKVRAEIEQYVKDVAAAVKS